VVLILHITYSVQTYEFFKKYEKKTFHQFSLQTFVQNVVAVLTLDKEHPFVMK